MKESWQAIMEIVHDAGGSFDIGSVPDKLKTYEKHLRAHGWHHDGDEVDGKTVIVEPCIHVSHAQNNPCTTSMRDSHCNGSDRNNYAWCNRTRPATIKDLIT